MNCRASAHGARLTHVWRWVITRSSDRRTFSRTLGRREELKPYFITTPIFYPNSDPHLGHLYSTVVADILARYSLLKIPSRPVVFITGTDEHGAKIQKAARMSGLEGREQEFCDKISARFQNLATTAGLSHTRFIRTTEPEHVVAVQHLWRDLKARGFLYKGTHSGWYSISDECFYTDSQVQPHTNPTQPNGHMVSKETGNIVEWSQEENYKFRLSAFRTQLLQRYSTDTTAILPLEQRDVVIGLLNAPDNIADISVSRPSTRLQWGIPVPDDTNHTIYVWLDALAAYLTAVGYPWTSGVQSGFPRGWPPDVQIIGKDILRFHAIYFPAFLMALDLPLPKTVVSHAHLTVHKKKMSKSVGNTADPFAILNEYEKDVVRYYLARIGGRYSVDKDWSESQLRKHQRELVSILGNLLSRAFSRQVVGRLPESQQHISIKPEVFAQESQCSAGDTFQQDMKHLHSALNTVIASYPVHMDKLEISHALQNIVECLGAANRVYTATSPWLDSTSVADTSRLLSYIRETLRICGILMQPFIPFKAQALLDALGVPSDRRALSDAYIGGGELPGDLPIAPVRPTKLFHMTRSDEKSNSI